MFDLKKSHFWSVQFWSKSDQIPGRPKILGGGRRSQNPKFFDRPKMFRNVSKTSVFQLKVVFRWFSIRIGPFCALLKRFGAKKFDLKKSHFWSVQCWSKIRPKSRMTKNLGGGAKVAKPEIFRSTKNAPECVKNLGFSTQSRI